jgi:hypothetical protein
MVHAHVCRARSQHTAGCPRHNKISPDARINPSVLDDFIATNQHAKFVVRSAAGYDLNRILLQEPTNTARALHRWSRT